MICTTFKARHAFEDVEAFVCVARYMHPREREEWKSIGVGTSPTAARRDLAAVLKEEGIEAPVLDECLDPNEQRVLSWAAVAHALTRGIPIVRVAQ